MFARLIRICRQRLRALFQKEGLDSELAREFAREDPWGYETPEGRRRFERELGLIESATGGGWMGMAFEIGCGEGHFTEILAPRCDV